MLGLLVFELHQGKKDSQQYILTGKNVCKIFEPSEKMPELVFATKNITGDEYHYCYPKEDEGKSCICATGNFITTSDSRFPNKYPLPLHRSQPHLFR